jgi:hypothetical protein
LICSDNIERGAVPVLVITAFCDGLLMFTACDEKVNEVGERLTAGLVPVPLNFTVCAGAAVPKFRLRLPVWTPGAVGLKTTAISHFCPAAAPVEQLSVSENGPVTEISGALKAASP